MKKTSILSMLTFGMILATSVGTYAVWDTLSAQSSGQTVTIRNPVTVTAGTQTASSNAEAALGGATATATGSVTFDVANKDNLANQLTLEETIFVGTESPETTLASGDYSIEFKKQPESPALVGKIDSNVSNDSNTYYYTITFNKTGIEKLQKNSNQCKVKVTATLSHVEKS